MKRTSKHLPEHSGRRFTWTGRVGVADESDLGSPYFSQVWEDACDVGFRVRSHATSKVITFVYHRIVRPSGDDSDNYALVFRAIDDSGLEVHVIND